MPIEKMSLENMKFEIVNFRRYQKIIHAHNRHWWHDRDGNRLDRNKGELLCLVHSEISEFWEGVQTGKADDHLPHYPMWQVELADTAIRVFDYAEGFGHNLIIPYGHTEPHLSDYRDTARTTSDLHARVSAAMEGERKSKRHPVHMEMMACEVALSGLLQDIRLIAVSEKFDIAKIIAEKVAYNDNRADHTYESMAHADGKKW